ncbi:hypothetical protein V5O48_019006 [Marasmius crinis-equi]|uniref:ABC transmembrane type-1 domain-containing protein n=1 Tax=Marasmius crinis-equi TaxID=585013 RepID=A0ABR3EJN4_9AGAR
MAGVSNASNQSAWLRNASIKDNILFNLPYDEARYQKTLEACALIPDMEILEDGNESEIGERGVNLSGGQKARVSLARAVYSRASILFLDDVLSAVDAHTAHHLYHECLKGGLIKGRTVILVSHHVQLCAPGADYIVALDNGRVQFEGKYGAFQASGVMKSLVHSTATVDDKGDVSEEQAVGSNTDDRSYPGDSESTTVANANEDAAPSEIKVKNKKPARKLVEEEARAVGRVDKEVWMAYFRACGRYWYWTLFLLVFLLAALSPVAEKGWLRIWMGAVDAETQDRGPLFYIGIYAAIAIADLIISTYRWLVLYSGSIQASTVLYKRLLETVLFANIRFHDTVTRGRLLNRFGTDFEDIDSDLSDDFGNTLDDSLSSVTTLIAVATVGGIPFVVVTVLIGAVYYNSENNPSWNMHGDLTLSSVGKVYGQTSRDMRRLGNISSHKTVFPRLMERIQTP